MSQASISDDESQLSSVLFSTTIPSIDPGDSGSVFQATPAARGIASKTRTSNGYPMDNGLDMDPLSYQPLPSPPLCPSPSA